MAGEIWTAHGPSMKGPATLVSGAPSPGRDERHAARLGGNHLGGGHDGVAHPGHRDVSLARVTCPPQYPQSWYPRLHQPPSPLAMRSIPVCGHTASLSPPGAPETPMEPTSSWPAIIGKAPSAVVMLARCSAPAPVGVEVTRLPYS